MLSPLFEDLQNKIHVIYLANINRNIIQVYNDDDIWLLGIDFIDLVLETC